jgi:hypothetical protein
MKDAARAQTGSDERRVVVVAVAVAVIQRAPAVAWTPAALTALRLETRLPSAESSPASSSTGVRPMTCRRRLEDDRAAQGANRRLVDLIVLLWALGQADREEPRCSWGNGQQDGHNEAGERHWFSTGTEAAENARDSLSRETVLSLVASRRPCVGRVSSERRPERQGRTGLSWRRNGRRPPIP